MDESPYSLSREDCNSNQIINNTTDPTYKHGVCDHSLHCHGKNNSGQNRTFSRARSSVTLNSPSNVFNASFCQKDLSYDDLSKNIDANLAEIDMETFRSEDINSILALPAIYSGNYESVCHGEQCASVSGSLLSGLEIDVSVNNRTSEDEISICKDEPLFSPQREPANQDRAISVDSLDNSSSYDQDLVLTCKANKNNYTIVFEGSETQFSEESEYHNTSRSSVSSTSDALPANSDASNTSSSMIQSDLVLTTWSNLKRLPFGDKKRRRSHSTSGSVKSQSLPDFSNQQAAFIWDKSWSKFHGKRNASACDLNFNHRGGLQVLRNCRYAYSLSLVKLFMKYKVSSRLSECSSEDSGSLSSVFQALNNINNSTHDKLDHKDLKDKFTTNQNYNIKTQGHDRKEIELKTQKKHLYVDNIRILDWKSAGNTGEANNNIINSSSPGSKYANKNILKDENLVTPSEECDNSQVFEDSLIEPPLLQLKNFHAMPIKEEEETDISSGDEVMKSSKFSNETSNDLTMVKNNTVDTANPRPDNEHNLERINNIFPSNKANLLCAEETQTDPDRLEKNLSKDDSLLENQNEKTPQAKPYNTKNCINTEGFNLQNKSTKVTSKQASSVEKIRQYSPSRDTSPNSSGYSSSRHSSVERMPRSCSGLTTDASNISIGTQKIRGKVFLTTTRNFATQVPVHVIDRSMQTSTLARSHPNVGFLLRDSNDNIEQSDCKSPSPKEAMQRNVSVMSKSCSKDHKCIYVCFPNYSLPDLSFLNSVMMQDSGSVFLSPTKFKPPQVLKTHHIRPRSSDALDPNSRKRLSDIKDWDSLNVLLPDDFKQMISQMQLHGDKTESSTENSRGNSPLSVRHTKHETKSDFSKYLIHEKQSPQGILRKCAMTHAKKSQEQLILSQEMSMNFNVCKCPNRNCDKLRKREVPQCSCISTTYDSCSNFSVNTHAKHSTSKGSDHFLKNNELASEKSSCQCFDCCSNKSSFRNVKSGHRISSLNNNNSGNESLAVSNGNQLYAANEYPTSDRQKKKDHIVYPCTRDKNSKIICKSGCDKGFIQNQENPIVEFDPPNQHTKLNEHNDSVQEDESNITHKNYFDLEKIPDDLLMTSIQNPMPYSVPPDLYLLQNSLEGGNKLFYESLKRKTGLVENLQKAAILIFEHFSNAKKHAVSSCSSVSVGQKILTSLCPAVHTILSDGLLPSVQGFFGLIPNSPWKVAEASVQLEKGRKEVQDLLLRVNSEKLLTDSTYKFNAFIIGLLNLGCLEWWLAHLLSSQALISYHYHPTALLSLLALPASSHLKQELTELVSPLAKLAFDLDLAFETKISSSKPSHSKCKVDCVEIAGNYQGASSGQNAHKDAHVKCLNEGNDAQRWSNLATNAPIEQSPKRREKKERTFHVSSLCSEQKGSSPSLRVRNAEAPLLTSADSGCSSQVCQTHDIGSVMDFAESVNKQESHQFRQLQQKWEKITLGMETQGRESRGASPSADPVPKNVRVAKKPTETQRKPARTHVSIKIASEPERGHTKRAVSQPPTFKKYANDRLDIYYEKKYETPDVVASSKVSSPIPEREKRSRSQIPMLKLGKGVQSKSRIPVQKTGLKNAANVNKTNKHAQGF